MSDFPSRFPAWVKWIPAVVLAIIITIVIVFAVNEGPRLAEGPGPAQSNEVDDLNFSVFTDDGLSFIDAQRIPRIDLREPPVETEPLGLPSDGELVIGPHPQNLDYRLVLLADGGEGGARFTTATFSIATESGAIRELRIQPPREFAAAPFREIEAYATESAERFGYSPPPAGTLLDLVLAAQQSGQLETTSTEVGEAIGLPTQLEVSCGGDGFCLATIVIAVPR